ncbi:MAG: hypothetical protein JNK05_24380 [Myxococcales bacterium]|nr:hypothetical protein [Myxococcales bacterium]
MAHTFALSTRRRRSSLRTLQRAFGAWLLAAWGCAGTPTPSDTGSSDASSDALRDDAGPDGATSDGAVAACRDPAALASQRRCLADEHCPCGAHCELGRCVATCRADSECAAQERCDRFGRCRPAVDTSLTAPPASTTSGRVELSARRVTIARAGATTSFVLRARGAVSVARVAADPGTEVRCESAASFATECTISAMADGTSRSVEVRASATRPDDNASTDVRVYVGSAMDVVAVEPAPAAAAPPRFAGVYSGTATLNGTAYDSATPPLADVSTKLVLPIRASVFGTSSDGTLRIDDVLRGIAPDGALIGAITADATQPRVSFPAFVLYAGRLATSAPTEVVATPLVAPMIIEQSPGATGAIQFDLTLRHDGNTQGARSLFTRFRVRLDRVGDLPAGASAPSVPASVERTITTSGFVSTPWEEAASAALAPFEDFAQDSTIAGAVRSPLGESLHPTNNRSVAACRFDLSEAARALTTRRWRDAESTAPVDLATYDPASDTTATTSNPSASLALLAAITPASTTAAPFAQLSERGARIIATAAPGSTIPCEITGQTTALRVVGVCGTFGGARSFSFRTIDRCAAIAAQTGCVPEPTSGPLGSNTMTVDATLVSGNGACTATGSVPLRITRVCRLQTQLRCGELYSCLPRNAAPTIDSLASGQATGPTLNAITGDLACDNGRTIATPANASPAASVQALLPLCFSEIQRLQQAIPTITTSNGAALATLLGTTSCYDSVRALLALGWALHPARRVAAGTPVANDERSASHAHRLLQQWFETRTFVLRESVQRARLPAAIAGAAANSGPPARDALRQSLDGWELLTHPRFASAIARLPDAVVERPDHRASLGITMGLSPAHPHGVGVSVSMLELLALQLRSLSDLVETAALETGDRALLADVSRALRLAQIVHSVTETLYQRALASAASASRTLAWAARYRSARESAQSALRQLVDRSAILAAGQNPLGINDDDLPLYFFGDEATATRRFSAISDFIAGQSATSAAWAPSLVAQATGAANAARAAWTAQATRRYAQQLTATEQTNRINAALLIYGAQITGYCGAPAGLATPTVVDGWTNFNASRCFYEEKPECAVDRAALDRAITTQHARARFCIAAAANTAVAALPMGAGRRVPRFADSGLDAVMALCRDNVEVADGCGPGGARCVRCVMSPSGPSGPATIAALTEISDFDALTETQKFDIHRRCSALSPVGESSLPSAATLPNSPLDRADCYRGSLGERALGVRRARDGVEAARARLIERRESYDIAMRSCYLRREGDMRILASSRRHEAHMRTLREGQLAADLVKIAADATNDCLSSGILGFLPPDPVACGLGYTAAAAEATSRGLEFEMQNLRAQHDLKVMGLESRTDFRVCASDAEQHLVGMNTAAIELRQAQLEAEQLSLELVNAIGGAEDIFFESQRVVAGLRAAAAVRMPDVDLWVDESIETYVRAMRQARRATYLAVRAVEYEYQTSLDLRARVLAATTPTELASALSDLQATAATRSISGRRPSSLLTVLSLRDDVLQLADVRGDNPALANLSPAERLRTLLRDARYAVYDERGVYAGQRVPFRLAPLGAMGLGDVRGVPLYATTDCAERVWSVNASILGSSSLYRGSGTTFARVDLLKSNSFFSQWCSPSRDGTAFQHASVQPERNLFRDPQFGVAPGVGGSTGVGNTSRSETRARIRAYFNVSRADFEQTMYANGESSEMAARGLFGEYALFIPAAQISQRMPDGTYSNGLDLDAVDDILLRLDYVSVAR